MRATPTSARALNDLGRRLASDKSWWGSATSEASGRSVIRCTSEDAEQWNITVSEAIGAIGVGSATLLVLPKIPLEHFWHIVAQSERWPRISDDDIGLQKDRSLIEIVASWFLVSVERLLRRDLIRDYVPCTADEHQLRGRLLALPTSGNYYAGNLALSCEFEEFDCDTALNRVVKAAAKTALSIPVFPADIRRRIRRVLLRMTEVGDLQPGDLTVETERRSAYYATALILAKHILRGHGRALSTGSNDAWSFLIRTPELVEDGLRAILARGLVGTASVEKRGRALAGAVMTVNPDLIFGGGVAIGDIKYKVRSSDWTRSDLYQSVAFAAAFKAARACVISFGRSSEPSLPIVGFGDVRVTPISWFCDSSPIEAEERFVASVREWLRSP